MATTTSISMARMLLALFIAISCLSSGVRAQLDNVTLEVDVPDVNPIYNTTVYLGDELDLNVTANFDTTGSHDCSVTVVLPSQLLADQDQVSVDYGDGISGSAPTSTYANSQMVIDLGTLTVTVAGDLIVVSLEDIQVYMSGTIDEPLSVTATVECGSSSGYDQADILFLGPEINTEYSTDDEVYANTIRFGTYQETQLSVTLPASYTFNNLFLDFEITSSDFEDDIPFEITAGVVTYDDSDLSFSDNTSLDVTSLNKTTTVASSRRKRDAGDVTVSFTWSIGDVSNVGSDSATFIVTVTYLLSKSDSTVSGSSLNYYISLNFDPSITVVLLDQTLTIAEPVLTLSKSATIVGEHEYADGTLVDRIQFELAIEHSTGSNAAAYDVTMEDEYTGLNVVEVDPRIIIGTNKLTFTTSKLFTNETLALTYIGYLSDNQVNVIKEDSPDADYTPSLTWSYPDDPVASGARSYATDSAFCLSPSKVYQESVLYQAGIAALVFFIAFLVGAVVVAIICLLCVRVFKRGPFSTVYPLYQETQATKGLVLGTKGTKKTGYQAFKENSMVDVDESIVLILSIKDKNQTDQELEKLDILQTITVDLELELQRTNMMVESTTLLIEALKINEDISKDVGSKCVGRFQRNVKDLTKKMSDNYRQEVNRLMKRLGAVNKARVAELQRKQNLEKKALQETTKGMSEEEAKDFWAIIEKQWKLELGALVHLLKLEQEEEQVKLRQEFSVRKRIGVKNLQHNLMEEVKTQGELNEEKASWLMEEHRKNMAMVEKLMDDEISRQRMLLTEKLARRKALAASKESQENHSRQALNTMVKQQFDLASLAEERGHMTAEQTEAIQEKIKKEMTAAKQKLDKEQSKQEEALHKRLSDLKKKKLHQKEQAHLKEMEDFEKEQKVKQKQGELISPENYLERKAHLVFSQKSELNELENALDEEASRELEALNQGIILNTKKAVKSNSDKLVKDLMGKGLTENLTNEILEQHDRDQESLAEAREEEKKKQEKNLKKQLAKKRKEWAKRKQEEKEEQQQLREQEDKIVGRLIATQTAMSEEDRDKIMQEHEKQVVQLENSLTLSKLRQMRLLEERIATKKTKQLQKLEKKQHQEKQRQKRNQQLADSEAEADEEQNSESQEMLKRHAEEKTALLQGAKIKMDDELENVKAEMLEERSRVLREQEDRIGAMVATLQMEKAREMAIIEDQQKQLNNLKMNMMEDLTERGVMSNPEAKKIIEKHRQQMDQLESKLETQKQKQEKEIKKRLREKMAQKEKSFVNHQETELRQVIDQESNKLAARIRRVAMKHKQLMELEDFRNKIAIEMSQTFEDLRRSFEVKRLQLLQEQELSFIAGLVKYGKFGKEELKHILALLFPTYSDQKLGEIMNKIYEKVGENGKVANSYDSDDEKGDQNKTERGQMSNLEMRIEAVSRGETPEEIRKKLKSTKLNKKNTKLAPLGKKGSPGSENFKKSKLPSINRPPPLGRNSSDLQYDSDDSDDDSIRVKKKKGNKK